jgi:hypothetical protein
MYFGNARAEDFFDYYFFFGVLGFSGTSSYSSDLSLYAFSSLNFVYFFISITVSIVSIFSLTSGAILVTTGSNCLMKSSSVQSSSYLIGFFRPRILSAFFDYLSSIRFIFIHDSEFFIL